jgi:hypothetical protein
MDLASVDKFNVNINPCFYGKQKFDYGGGYIANIESGFIVNTTFSYAFHENSQLYLTARNLFADKQPQFAFADPIMPMILTGIRIRL